MQAQGHSLRTELMEWGGKILKTLKDAMETGRTGKGTDLQENNNKKKTQKT